MAKLPTACGRGDSEDCGEMSSAVQPSCFCPRISELPAKGNLGLRPDEAWRRL